MSAKAKLPPPPRNGAPPPDDFIRTAPAPQAESREYALVGGTIPRAQRVLLYGKPGIGKTTLASLIAGVAFVDIAEETSHLDVLRIGTDQIRNWSDLRACIQSNLFDGSRAITLDNATTADGWSISHTLDTVPHEKGHRVKSIEGYGFGKGLSHNYDTFLPLLMDFDRHIRAGRHVILIAHDCISDTPNPTGDDFIRYEPHLQGPKSGKASIRNRVIQWADHVLFVGYDIVAKDGKGTGGGTRTIYTDETPAFLAKSRSFHGVLPFTGPEDGAIWDHILGGQS